MFDAATFKFVESERDDSGFLALNRNTNHTKRVAVARVISRPEAYVVAGENSQDSSLSVFEFKDTRVAALLRAEEWLRT